jgi:hypothetical protein
MGAKPKPVPNNVQMPEWNEAAYWMKMPQKYFISESN